jgi:hypothetical protein
MSRFWHLAITALTLVLAVYLHRAAWRLLRTGDRSRILPAFWALCAALFALGVSGFAAIPATALGLDALPEHSVALVIAATGLLGIRLCLLAGIDAGAVLSSGMVLSGLVFGLYSGPLWLGAAAILSVAYFALLCTLVNRTVVDETGLFENKGVNIAGKALSLDEAHPHSR